MPKSQQSQNASQTDYSKRLSSLKEMNIEKPNIKKTESQHVNRAMGAFLNPITAEGLEKNQSDQMHIFTEESKELS